MADVERGIEELYAENERLRGDVARLTEALRIERAKGADSDEEIQALQLGLDITMGALRGEPPTDAQREQLRGYLREHRVDAPRRSLWDLLGGDD